jgi:E3 ubiquitin-protein ligase DOA10
MKQSTSTNSLTALTEANFEKECFICIDIANESGEPLVDSRLLRTCGCKFMVHPECWNIWIKDKSDWDCPICHKKSMSTTVTPNPILIAIQEEQRVVPPKTKIRMFLVFFAAFFIISLIFLVTVLVIKK